MADDDKDNDGYPDWMPDWMRVFVKPFPLTATKNDVAATPQKPPASTLKNDPDFFPGMTAGDWGPHTTKVGKVVYAKKRKRMTEKDVVRIAARIDETKITDEMKYKDTYDILAFILGVCVSFFINLLVDKIKIFVNVTEFFLKLVGRETDISLLIFNTMADLYGRVAAEMLKHGPQIRKFGDIASEIYGAKE